MIKQETPEAKEDRLIAMINGFLNKCPNNKQTEEEQMVKKAAVKAAASPKAAGKAAGKAKAATAIKATAKAATPVKKPLAVKPFNPKPVDPKPAAAIKAPAKQPMKPAMPAKDAQPAKEKAPARRSLSAFVRDLHREKKHTDAAIEKMALAAFPEISEKKAHGWTVGVRNDMRRAGEMVEKIEDSSAKT